MAWLNLLLFTGECSQRKGGVGVLVGVAHWRSLPGKSADAGITLLPWCKLRAINLPALGCVIALQGLLNAAFK